MNMNIIKENISNNKDNNINILVDNIQNRKDDTLLDKFNIDNV